MKAVNMHAGPQPWPGTLRLEIAAATLEVDTEFGDGFTLLCRCPLCGEEEVCVVRPISEEEVDVHCEAGCSVKKLAAYLKRAYYARREAA